MTTRPPFPDRLSEDDTTETDERPAFLCEEGAAESETPTAPPLEFDVLPPPPSDRAPFVVPLTSLSPPPPPKPARSRRPAVIAVLAVSFGVVIAGLTDHVLAPEQTAAAAALSFEGPVRLASAGVEPAPPSPLAEEVETAPQPAVAVNPFHHVGHGTVVGKKGHRLWIDGSLADGWRTEVSCGPHEVQVGSSGAHRTLDVGCGEEVSASP